MKRTKCALLVLYPPQAVMPTVRADGIPTIIVVLVKRTLDKSLEWITSFPISSHDLHRVMKMKNNVRSIYQ